MEFARSQAVASGDAFEHRPPECGHCVQNFLADLDLRDLPGEAARFELGADHALPTTDLRFYPAALVVPCGHLPCHAAVAADLGNMAIPNGWIPRRLRSDHCVLRRRYNHIQGLPIPLPQHIPYRRSISGWEVTEQWLEVYAASGVLLGAYTLPDGQATRLVADGIGHLFLWRADGSISVIRDPTRSGSCKIRTPVIEIPYVDSPEETALFKLGS